jgi:hypothetical protein
MKHIGKFVVVTLMLVPQMLAGGAPNSAANFFEQLKAENLKLLFCINQYDYNYNHNVVSAVQLSVNKTTTRLKYRGSEWMIKFDRLVYDAGKGVWNVQMSAEVVQGALSDAVVGIAFRMQNWDVKDYLLMPAAAYNGNRFESRRIAYSPKLLDPKDIGPDKGIIISDVPRLNINEGPSQISLRCGDLAAPFVGIHHNKYKKGFLFYFKPQNNWGDHGIVFQENRSRNEALLTLTTPVLRRGYQYRIADNQYDSKDLPANFKKGDRIEFEFQLTNFQAAQIQDLFDKSFELRYPEFLNTALPAVHPFSSVFQVLEKKFNEQNFVPEFGYYSVGMRETYTQDWAIGWTGGMITTYPLYFAGADSTKKNVIRNFNWLFPKGIAPSGFFWETGEKGTIWYGGDQRKFHTKEWHIIRRSADALYFILKQLFHFQREKVAINAEWEKGLKSVADAFVRLWDTHGQMGQFVNSITGKIVVGGSTSAAIAPAALLYAYKYFGDENYRRVALQSAEYFYQNYIQKGITCGGPGDALQNPDSESSYSMLESFMVLYEQTGDAKWLQRSREMAHQFATWVMPYNYVFPNNSLFGRMNFKTVGTVWANTQNKHSATGICTHSGSALLRLFRYTGDMRYARLLQEIARAIPQYLSHPDKPIGAMKIGWISERVNTTDWLEGIGEMAYMTTWAETAMMLTKLEVPGLYLHPEKAIAIAFDNIECKIVSADADALVIELSNPTKQHARITYFIDGNADDADFYGNFNRPNGPVLSLAAGEVRRIKLDRRSKVLDFAQ